MSITTTFIIPHKGREEMLLETLQSIANLDSPKEEYEVIVVSQNEVVSEEVSLFSKQLNLEIIHNNANKTISHSRNLGAHKAKGQYLAFLDADIRLAQNWLQRSLEIIKTRNNTALVSAMQVSSGNATPLEKIRTALSNAELDSAVSFLPGRNLFLAKETFVQAGQFPEHLMTCEDYYFTDKVNKIGDLFYTSTTHYGHIGEDKAFIPMCKKEVWRGQSNLASLKGRAIPLREVPSFIVPFVVTGCALLSVLALIFSQWILSCILLVGAIVPLVAYSVRLNKLTSKTVSFYHCMLFYLLYFPARALGTLLGVSGAVTTSSIK